MTNQMMLSKVAYVKETDEGQLGRVKELYLIPGETFSTAEEFVYETVLNGNREAIIESLKRESVEGIFYQDEEIQEEWYKCKATVLDAISEKDFKIVCYVNANSTGAADEVMIRELKDLYLEFSITGVTLTKVVDVFVHQEEGYMSLMED